MLDYFFHWQDEAEAKQDVLMLADFLNVASGDLREWARDKVLPNVRAWRPSQDVGGVHTYLTGWYAIVSLDRQVQVLLNAAALAFCLDRDACNAGQPFVIRNNIGAVLQDVACEPVFAGSNYPIGGYS